MQRTVVSHLQSNEEGWTLGFLLVYREKQKLVAKVVIEKIKK